MADDTKIAPRDDTVPSSERQAQLHRQSSANLKARKALYEGVRIETAGELQWIMSFPLPWSRTRSAIAVGTLIIILVYVVVLGGVVFYVNFLFNILPSSDAWSYLLASLPLVGLMSLVVWGAWVINSVRSARWVGIPLVRSVDLRRVNLEGVNLQGLELGSVGRRIYLQDANLSGAHLEGADFSYSVCANADLGDAHLEGADFTGARLRGANLSGAFLQNTNLSSVDLRWAKLDSVRVVRQIIVDSRTRLDKITWKNIPRLRDDSGKRPRARAAAHRDASRVYREAGLAFRQQGLSAQATAYRVLELTEERKADFWAGRIYPWLGSWILTILAGYGYRPGRTLAWYLVVVAGFAWGYVQVTNGASLFGLQAPTGVRALQWYEALVLSVSAFHGRGFFQPLQNPGDPVAMLAAAEAVVGLFIEISFIATFTQRFFGAR